MPSASVRSSIYGPNIYQRLIDPLEQGRWYQVRVRYRNGWIEASVDGLLKFVTTNPLVAGAPVQGLANTGWDLAGSGFVDLIEARQIPTTSFVNPLKLDFHTGGAPGTITTFAGTGTAGYGGDGGPAVNALMDSPGDVAIDSDGNVYVAEHEGNWIRRINTDGTISTIAGDGTPGDAGEGGPATAAQVNGIWGLAFDDDGNLYLADSDNTRVRVVATDGILRTFAGTGDWGFGGDGGPATSAWLFHPTGVGVDEAGNVYIADSVNARIRRVDATTGIISTVAGNGVEGYSGDGGPAISASLTWPAGVAFRNGNLLIADSGNHVIRQVTPEGIISTIAGDGSAGSSGDGGPATSAQLDEPWKLAVGDDGSVYIVDGTIRKIDPNGIISTVAGNGTYGSGGDGGPAVDAQLMAPSGVALDRFGNLYISDYDNHKVRRVTGPAALLRVLTIANADGSAGPNWQASESMPWLTLSAYSGIGPSSVTATVNTTGLNPGTYLGSITVEADGGAQVETIPVELTILP